jgi:hypothetical protein
VPLPVMEPPETESPAPASQESSKAPALRRAVGLRVSLHPQLSGDADIQLTVTLQATVPVRDEALQRGPSIVRSREITTTMLLEPGEITLLPAMFRVDDFGDALVGRASTNHSQQVVVAIGASVLRARAMPSVLAPLPIGTEQRIRFRDSEGHWPLRGPTRDHVFGRVRHMAGVGVRSTN